VGSVSCARIALAVMPLAALAAPAFAVEVPPGLTLDDCVRLAEEAPSPVAVARRQQEIARARVASAQAGLLPHLSASFGYTRNSGLTAAPEVGSFVSLNGINQYTGVVALTEEVDLSGRLRAGVTRAHAEEDAAGAELQIQRRDLRRLVATAYHRALLARRLVQVGAGALAEAEQFAQRTELLAQKGEAARADLVRAAAQVAALRQSHRAALLEAQLTNQELAAFFRDDVGTTLALVDVLDQAPAPPRNGRPGALPALRRPELALLQAQRRGLLADARQARALRLPQAGLTAEYGLDSNQLAWRDRGYALLLTLTVPILDWAAASNNARQFTLQAEQTDIDRALFLRAASREYAAAEARVQALYEQIAFAREQVNLSEQSLKLSRVRYEGGEGSALEVVSAQTDLTAARTSYYQAIAGHLQARVDLTAAGGAP
jgi:outer membrane protein